MTPDTYFICKYGSTSYLTYFNYHTWVADLDSFLSATDGLDIVLGHEQPPAANRPAALHAYMLRYARAATMIFNSSSPSIKALLRDMKNPKTMWDLLKAKLDIANSRAGRASVLLRFNTLLPTAEIEVYITSLIDCRNQLIGTDEEINDAVIVSKLVTQAPTSFKPLAHILKRLPQDQLTLSHTINSFILFNKKLLYEASLGELDANSNPTSTNALTAPTTPTPHRDAPAFASRNRSTRCGASGVRKPPYRGRRSSRSTSFSRITCWCCGKDGHEEVECRKKRAEGRDRGNVGYMG